MVLLQIYGTLRMMLGGRESVELPWHEGDTVGALLERFQAGERIPVTHKLVDDRRMLHTGTIILLNRRNVLHLDRLETPVRDGDVLALFPPGAGG
ncbi:MoaD/ThiS family protein [Geomonas ferrireducens]|uniref:MoaD/ThiS family protein n=1 Tax=Geomonas ferrireducens TaxID=2570227 RepID=UPI0010A79A5A|nr:MoaD/ThiS family protein [Geomonas ferrireducens]